MAENRVDTMPANGAPAVAPAAPAAPVAPTAGGGLKAWLPLIAALVLMPAMAYVTTQYLLVPKLEKVVGAPSGAASAEAPAKSHSDGKIEPGKPKYTYSLNKVLVNVSGSIGTRYLIANYTLVGSSPDFKTRIEEDRDQLLDLASSVMGTKTISDLEKPGARNLIRNELMAAFNNALGGSVVKEIYITEFAIQ